VPRHPAPAALDGQVGQPLLSAVVEVALDAPAGLVGGGGDPGPRRGELRAQLGVVEGDRELRGDEVDRVQPVGGERVVDEAVLQHQHRPQAAPAEHVSIGRLPTR
jgi:hypothetical protein